MATHDSYEVESLVPRTVQVPCHGALQEGPLRRAQEMDCILSSGHTAFLRPHLAVIRLFLPCDQMKACFPVSPAASTLAMCTKPLGLHSAVLLRSTALPSTSSYAACTGVRSFPTLSLPLGSCKQMPIPNAPQAKISSWLKQMVFPY